MSTQPKIVQNGQYWFVVTSTGQVGPLDTEQEAIEYTRLMQMAEAAGNEIACTDAECLS